MARISDFLRNISPVGEALEAISAGQRLLEGETAERNNQLSVSTAEEGLALWEQDYSMAGGTALANEVRRSRIRTAMAGGRTLTPALLEQLAVTVGGADAGALEEDFAQWRAGLRVIYENRLPEGMDALEESVERLKPAHLAVELTPNPHLTGAMTCYQALTAGLRVQLHSKTEQPA